MLELRKSTVRMVAAVAVAVLTFVVAPTASAKKENPAADKKIQTMTVEIKKLEVLDKRHVATAELGQAEALRDKARSLIGERRERDRLAQTLEELEATVALAHGKIGEAEKQAEVDARKAEIAKVRKQTEQVRKRVADLEKQIGGGK